MHRIPDNPYILWVENIRDWQSSERTRLMKQLCLTLPLISNGEECPDSRQSHRAVYYALVPSIRRVERFVPKNQKAYRLWVSIPTPPALLV